MMPRLTCGLMVFVWLVSLGQMTVISAEPDGMAFFEKKIRPVLVQHCYECHSAKAKSVKGNLLLDSRDATLKGGDSGPAVVPGKVDESLLIQAVRQETFEMPPKGKLPDQVIADLEEWVRIGAPDPRTAPTVQKREGIDLE